MTTSSTSSIFGTSMNGSAIGGLMSGLDTASLVEQMMQSSQLKLDREYQEQKTVEYEQEAYREIIDMLVGFSDSYFSNVGGSSIFNSSFFQADDFTPSSDFVDVSGDADAIANLVINNIESVASKASHSSSHKVTDGKISGNGAVITEEMPLNQLAGESITIKVGEATGTIKISEGFTGETLDDVVAELNTQIGANENLKDTGITYVNSGGQLKLLDNSSATEFTGEITGVSSGFGSILHVAAGSSGMSSEVVDETAFVKNIDLNSVFSENKMNFTYNGVTKSIDLSSATLSNATDLQTAMQTELNKAFGTGKITVGLEAGEISFEATGSNNTLSISNVSENISALTGLTNNSTNSANLDTALNEMNFTTTLDGGNAGNYTITVNGKDLTFAETDSVSDIMSKINSDESLGITMSYSRTTDTFNFTSNETGSQATINISDKEGNLAATLFGGNIEKTGTDTKMTATMNGSEMEIVRSTSNFTLDGVTLDISSQAAGQTDITFDVNNNVDEVASNVAKFVDEYNKIINHLDEAISQRPDSDYSPLTDAQKEEMSDTEIENWEEKAKEGILFGDSNIRDLLYDMRDAMSGFVADAGMLNDIGIEYPTGEYSGQLVFDEDKFKEAYAKDPSMVEDIFTKESDIAEEQGLAVRLQSVFENNVGTMGNKGILADHSGTVGMTNEDQNYLSDRISEYEDAIQEMIEKMEEERERYWSQFTALETALASMNEQMASISGMFSS